MERPSGSSGSSGSSGKRTGSEAADIQQHVIFIERAGSLLAVPVDGWHEQVDLSRSRPVKVTFKCVNPPDRSDAKESCDAGSGSVSSVSEITGSPESHDVLASDRITSDSEDFCVPGLLSDGSESGTSIEGPQTDARIATQHNSLEAHENGTCKPCRFFHMKEEGCRIGAACKFCHYCTREEARRERLTRKYDDRRVKRRLGRRLTVVSGQAHRP